MYVHIKIMSQNYEFFLSTTIIITNNHIVSIYQLLINHKIEKNSKNSKNINLSYNHSCFFIFSKLLLLCLYV